MTCRICRQFLFTQAILHLHYRAGVTLFLFLQESRDFARHESFQSNTIIESLLFHFFHWCDRQLDSRQRMLRTSRAISCSKKYLSLLECQRFETSSLDGYRKQCTMTSSEKFTCLSIVIAITIVFLAVTSPPPPVLDGDLR